MVGKRVGGGGGVKETNKNILRHFTLNRPLIRDFLINLHEVNKTKLEVTDCNDNAPSRCWTVEHNGAVNGKCVKSF